jgi:sugar phosphate isomerase/epimerase
MQAGKLAYAFDLARCDAYAGVSYSGSLDEACAELSSLGYQGLELFVRDPSQLDGASLSRTLGRHALTVCAVSTGPAATEDGLSFTDPKPEVRHATVARTREIIDFAADLGTHIHVGRLRGNVGNDGSKNERWKRLIDTLLEVATYGEERGVRVLIEPQCRFIVDNLLSVPDTVDFLRSLGHPNLGIVADTFHMNVEDVSISASIVSAGDYLRHMHFADSNRRYPGGGHLDFQEIVEGLQLIGYTGFITMEVEQIPDSKTAAARAASLMETLWSRL